MTEYKEPRWYHDELRSFLATAVFGSVEAVRWIAMNRLKTLSVIEPDNSLLWEPALSMQAKIVFGEMSIEKQTACFRGRPIASMSREELMNAVVFLSKKDDRRSPSPGDV